MMNSVFGALGNRYFLYYINDVAEAITTAGQVAIKKSEQVINRYLNSVMKTDSVDYVLYCDTDSAFFRLDMLIEKVFGTKNITNDQAENFIDKVCKEKIEPEIAKGYEELAEQLTVYRNAMTMKREKICNKLIMCLHPDSKVFGGVVSIEEAYNRKMFGQLESYNVHGMHKENDLCIDVNRKWFKGSLIVIETGEGNVIKLTPDHLVLVKQIDSQPIWKRADELLPTDQLVLES